MANVLLEKNIIPDLIMSSTAVRAFEFAKVIAKVTGFKPKNIFRERDLYLASPEDMLKIVRQTGVENNIVFLVAHNPGITDFANMLANCSIDNIPTSGIVSIKFDVDSWKNVSFGKGQFEFFDYPRNYYKE